MHSIHQSDATSTSLHFFENLGEQDLWLMAYQVKTPEVAFALHFFLKLILPVAGKIIDLRMKQE